jgi:uncharacterized cupin superfamily protein
MTTDDAYLLIGPGGGVSVELGVSKPAIKVGPPLSAQIGLLESELPPGGGFPIPHWHEDLDEVFYVLEGQIEFLLGSEWRAAGAGSTVFVPAGTVHAFRNASGAPARQLVGGAPEVMELIADLGRHPREQWEEVHERHRSHYARPEGGRPSEELPRPVAVGQA